MSRSVDMRDSEGEERVKGKEWRNSMVRSVSVNPGASIQEKLDALFSAVKWRCHGIIKETLNKYPELMSESDEYGNTILHHLVKCQYEELFRMKGISAWKPTINTKNRYGETPVLISARTSSNATILGHLIVSGCDINASDVFGFTPLHFYCKVGDLVCSTLSVNAEGCYIDIMSVNGITPLMMATENTHMGVMRMLLEHGADCLYTRSGNIHSSCNLNSKPYPLSAIEYAVLCDVPDVLTLILSGIMSQLQYLCSRSGQNIDMTLLDEIENDTETINYVVRAPMHTFLNIKEVNKSYVIRHFNVAVSSIERALTLARSGRRQVSSDQLHAILYTIQKCLQNYETYDDSTIGSDVPFDIGHMAGDFDVDKVPGYTVFEQFMLYMFPHVQTQPPGVNNGELTAEGTTTETKHGEPQSSPRVTGAVFSFDDFDQILSSPLKLEHVQSVSCLVKDNETMYNVDISDVLFGLSLEAFIESQKDHLNKLDDSGHTPVLNLIKAAHLWASDCEPGDREDSINQKWINKCMCLFLKYGASLDIMAPKGKHALTYCVEYGEHSLLEILLSGDVDVNATQDEQGVTTLHDAVRAGDLFAVEMLINAGADVNIATNLQIEYSKRFNIPEYQYQSKEVVSKFHNYGDGPLHSAVKRNNLELIRTLLKDHSINMNIRNKSGITPAIIATITDNVTILNLLIEERADVNIADNTGWTPLHHASCSENKRIIRVLLLAGANRHATDKHGRTPVQVGNGFSSEKILCEIGEGLESLQDWARWTIRNRLGASHPRGHVTANSAHALPIPNKLKYLITELGL
ncbi:unnamed protein product [Owenia fusiformis]|uniref:Uncharacterized protein n=1 Tax=Owenia fusiformis TaxID=6347 RepID=A0A8S4Q3T9_OWEFU|nr:unnamed protein product [Owenia fusiformis]